MITQSHKFCFVHQSKLRTRETSGLHVTEETNRSLQQPRRIMVTYESSDEEDCTASVPYAEILPENFNIGALMDCGRTLYEAGDFNAAAGKFDEAIQSQDSDIQAMNNLCACKLKQELYNEALCCAEQVLEVRSILIYSTVATAVPGASV